MTLNQHKNQVILPLLHLCNNFVPAYHVSIYSKISIITNINCLKLTYGYLLKAGHAPGDIWVGSILAPGAKFEIKLDSGLLGHATYQTLRLSAFLFQARRFFHVFPI